jgi:hypothetical protein
MRLVHDFPSYDWPEDLSNWRDITSLVEDGDEETLYVQYEDKLFRRPMSPTNPDDLRQEYQSSK